MIKNLDSSFKEIPEYIKDHIKLRWLHYGYNKNDIILELKEILKNKSIENDEILKIIVSKNFKKQMKNFINRNFLINQFDYK